MEHLALEVFDRDGGGSKYAFLPDDTSITITETSEIFDSGDIWSHAFTLNIPANAHIFGTAGEMHGSRLHEQIDKRRARLWVEGLPLYYGYLRLDDEVEVDANGDIDISFESGQKTFKDMVDGIKANQVPMMGDVLIGMALDRKRTLLRAGAKVSISGGRIVGNVDDGTLEISNVKLVGTENFAQEFPKYVRPDGIFQTLGGNPFVIEKGETINTDNPYDDVHPYCNTSICYQKYAYKDNNGSLEKNPVREYKVSEPRRINPAPNFFVIYWLRSLMKHLNIHVSENQMSGIEDLRRLFFVNTKCAYKTKDDVSYTGNYVHFGPQSPLVPLPTEEEPAWELNVRGFAASRPSRAQLSHVGYNIAPSPKWHKAYATSENFPDADIDDVIKAIESGFGIRLLFDKNYTKVRIVLLCNVLRSREVHKLACDVTDQPVKIENSIRGFRLTYGGSDDNTDYVYKGFVLAKQKSDGEWITEEDEHDYSQWDMTLHYNDIRGKVGMLNKTCYVDMKTGNAYIVKIDKDYKDASGNAFPSLFECAGFMDAEDGDCTGSEETIKEINIGFVPAQVNAVGKESQTVILTASRGSTNYEITVGDRQFYSIFLGEEMGVTCNFTLSGSRSGGGETELIDMTPEEVLAITNDSLEWGQAGYGEGSTATKDEARWQSGLFEVATAAPVVVTDENGSETFVIHAGQRTYNASITGWVRDGYRIYLDDNYDVTDDLLSPLEKHEWGLVLSIMRGTDGEFTDAQIDYSKDLIEDEDNDTWDIIPGAKAISHFDTCDDYGYIWDYGAKIGYSGYDYGDKILSEAGFANQCNLKARKGPVPNSTEAVTNLIDSYITLSGFELWIVTEQGYYVTGAEITDNSSNSHILRICCVKSDGTLISRAAILAYIGYLQNGTSNASPADVNEILRRDSTGATVTYGSSSSVFLQNMIIAIDYDVTTVNDIIQSACDAYLKGNEVAFYASSSPDFDQDGRFSLKLRAEKPNPFFDPTQPENDTTNRRYLEITTPELRKRGLMDKFYKEFSYWIRNARIAKLKVRIGLAELRSIDKTVRQRVCDITGFIKKMQYRIDMQSGLGEVEMEVWYL